MNTTFKAVDVSDGDIPDLYHLYIEFKPVVALQRPGGLQLCRGLTHKRVATIARSIGHADSLDRRRKHSKEDPTAETITPLILEG